MENILQQILGELQTTNKKIDGLEKRMGGLEKRFDHLDSEVNVLKNGQAQLKVDVEQLNVGQEQMTRDIHQLNTGQEQLKDGIINGVGSYIDTVASHFDERFDDLKETTDDQQKMIHTLASRSIQHESEINALKQIVNN